jgi:phycocyanobilin lyase alpha subunit
MAGDPITEPEALRRLRLTDDPSAQYYAAWWLGRNRSTHPDTVPLLQQALRQRRPRDPGAGVEENAVARNAARALGKLGASATAAIPDLLATLDDADPRPGGPAGRSCRGTAHGPPGQWPCGGWSPGAGHAAPAGTL